MIADYIDQIIMFAVALWMTATGFGFIPIATETKPGLNGWWAHLIPHFKWMGPLLGVIAIFLALAK